MEQKEWIGLTSDEVGKRQEKFGFNELSEQKKVPFYYKIVHILMEPMFLLLLVAALIYFFLGEPQDGAIMLVFVVVIIAIEIYQEWKTDQTLRALKDLSAPKIKVERDQKVYNILSRELVPGDIVFIEEGVKIPADGSVVQANDLRVDESSLTGEAQAVWKHTASNETTTDYWRTDFVYTGTLVTTGSATILVEKTGAETEYGKIGKHLVEAKPERSPLEKQINHLVKICAGVAIVLLVLVAGITFFNTAGLALHDRIVESILSGITLAMAMIPEEFPVVLTVFLSMGAWRLAKKQSLIRKLPAIETMGALSVLAVDKTGTITENNMTVSTLWTNHSTERLAEIMGLASETDPYDPMEMAMLAYNETLGLTKARLFDGELLTEYSFTDELKMMGHVWKKSEEVVVAAKGSPESILAISLGSEDEKAAIRQKIEEFARQGLRVIAVGEQRVTQETIPETITDCTLTFLGLVGLVDPPRAGVKKEIARCQKAGIKVVMITGDNGVTAQAIAKQVGINGATHYLTGQEIDRMTQEELEEKVRDSTVFSRVTPEHKMKIIQAFKANGEVVAMTGDGVNDAPALKYADVGIAMGQRGSEVSREAADLILLDDNFSTILNTIKDGRRIYDNLVKAVGYILVIHIPIALAALFGPLMGLTQAALFLLPIHVVLLELVIDPTCSVVLERQVAEADIMTRPPRDPNEKLLSKRLVVKSVLQGLMIFIASFGVFYFTLSQDQSNDELARTMGLVVLIVANLFLVQVNSSKTRLAIQTFMSLIHDKVIWSILGGTIVVLFALIYSPFNQFFDLAALSITQLTVCIVVGLISVCWYDIVKIVRRNK
ncbi:MULTISPECIES: cation-translocating P-type ATPase [Enterococcus]|uniref:Calcium-translocating P-type ATPase, PMCA-type n=1 Tax=Enterococcus sulfureus ATCC 49903 TaxID=1140003 RepID=S0KXL5_9ENTE|nr:cation-translocating P-type ATPase [Enterococcus sulfureus]EOT45805.1 calcium-translocating P-type ATPase, PMCA-type [Enterococcus sulfureus ATCC 49903]EOT82930.1 calcium-translocating P-type ATPase, PMCA-type [Enterococcus sulfureus ATCC 49903]